MNRKLKYAMVGGGRGAFIGKVHREALRLDDTADLVAGVFNTDPRVNAQSGKELGVASDRVYGDWREMIRAEGAKPDEARIDFVSVCTPNHLHFPIAEACLKAGFHVMCEKPVTVSLKEALALEKLVAKTGLKFGLMHTYVGYPMVKLMRDMIANGKAGRICKIVVEYQQGSFSKRDFSKPPSKRDAWRMNPQLSGPSCCMGDIGVHAANLIAYVTGLKTERLLADVSSFAPGNPLDDDGTVLLALERGVKAVIISSKIATGEENGLRIHVYGDKAGLFWKQEEPNYLYVAKPGMPEEIWKRGNPYVAAVSPIAAENTRIPAGHPEGFIEAFADNYREFASSIRSGKDCDCPGIAAGVDGMRFIEAVVKSANGGSKWVKC